ncbi:WecB/TagA/CpsF family glycosyltransferase [bacterium]|nr:MAG: WecB/TagA/CpsF family glycosyltransferase [bacterium]
MPPLEILGCRVDDADLAEATARIAAFARDGRSHRVVTLGTEMIVHAHRDPAYRVVVNGADLIVADTIGVVYASRLYATSLRGRVAGIELLESLCACAASEGLPVYLLGAAPGVAEAAGAALAARHPGLRVAGTRDGYFALADAPDVAAAIRESGARILFAALGFPKQEYFLADWLSASGAGVGMGVGGSFDVLAGRLQRAPETFRRLGLEWLYRLLREPRRWRRQLALPTFVWLVALERLHAGKGMPSS